MLASMLAMCHNWVSPGWIAICGWSCPLTVRVVGAPMLMCPAGSPVAHPQVFQDDALLANVAQLRRQEVP